MGLMQALMSSAATIFFYALVVAAVWKLFQIAGDVSEIKAILVETRRTAATPPGKPIASAPLVAAGPISLESAEALLREVAAESHALAAEPSKTPVA